MLRLLLLPAFLLPFLAFSQAVGVGTVTPNPSSILDVTANNKGFLPPRLTTAQRDAIPSPAEGLVVYNLTTHCLNFFDGTVWVELCGATPPACDISASLTSGTVVVSAGSSGSTDLSLGVISGTVSSISTTVTGLPAGVTLSPAITNNPAPGAGTQTITLAVGIGVAPGSYPLTVTATSDCGDVETLPLTLQVLSTCSTFTPLAANQTFTVPAGVTSIVVKAWGAGGGGRCGHNGGGAGSQGGGGGAFAQGIIPVTPGQNLTVVVGTGGSGSAGGFGGGGNGGTGCWAGFGGGGLSGIFSGTPTNQANALLIAGGGGGGGNRCSGAGGGGAGGGLTGTTGVPSTCGSGGGTGGSQSAGGAAGAAGGTGGAGTNGLAISGGSGGNSGGCNGGGGGGGGGYYGGGGGGGGNSGGSCSGGGGGGGSSYAAPGVTGTAFVPGNQNEPGNAGDPDYTGTYGYGGQYDGPTAGQGGYIVICW